MIKGKTDEYYALRHKEMPTEDKVKGRYLSAVQMAKATSEDDEIEDDWTAYHKSLELSEFIKGDLRRLYMRGIEEEYFQTARQALLRMCSCCGVCCTKRHPIGKGCTKL